MRRSSGRRGRQTPLLPPTCWQAAAPCSGIGSSSHLPPTRGRADGPIRTAVGWGECNPGCRRSRRHNCRLSRFPAGTTGLSDFPCPFIIVVLLADSRCGPGEHPGQAWDLPASVRELAALQGLGCAIPARCVGTYLGSSTTRSPRESRHGDSLGVAFRATGSRRHSGQ